MAHFLKPVRLTWRDKLKMLPKVISPSTEQPNAAETSHYVSMVSRVYMKWEIAITTLNLNHCAKIGCLALGYHFVSGNVSTNYANDSQFYGQDYRMERLVRQNQCPKWGTAHIWQSLWCGTSQTCVLETVVTHHTCCHSYEEDLLQESE